MPGAETWRRGALCPLGGDRTDLRGRAGRVGGHAPDVPQAAPPAWHVVGRVHFHLTENRKDEETPFAFRPA